LPLLAHGLKWKLWHLKDDGIFEPQSSKVLRLLLEHGANPNQRLRNYSLWQYLLHFIREAVYERNRWPTWNWEAIQLMLEYGADADATCIKEGSEWTKATWPFSKDPPTISHDFQCLTLSQIISEIFDYEEASDLLTALHENKGLPTLRGPQQRRTIKRKRVHNIKGPSSTSSIIEFSYIRGFSFPLISSLGGVDRGRREDLTDRYTGRKGPANMRSTSNPLDPQNSSSPPVCSFEGEQMRLEGDLTNLDTERDYELRPWTAAVV